MLDEIGIDLRKQKPKTFEEIQDSYFDLVISLAPEAQHNDVALTRAAAAELEFWRMRDPSLYAGDEAGGVPGVEGPLDADDQGAVPDRVGPPG